ncbi:DUF2459 domain-containing protein [Pseudomonas sp. GCM10022186]|uniref:DUF2459 domain-containing protein n=1 Tax=Pseudomonas sp. GCM10022186 TaxID=3252650 RepID=UPI0036107D1F
MSRSIVLLVLLMLLGCSATQPVRAPSVAPCQMTRTFQVVNHGWHTGIVLASRDLLQVLPALGRDFRDHGYLELGWGDEDFYRTPRAGLAQALRALGGSRGSVLHVVWVPGAPDAAFPGAETVTLRVGEDGYRRLLARLAASFAATPQNGLQGLGHGLYGESRFYRARGRYSLAYTCNTWVAEAVAASGIALSSTSVLTADGVMSRLREAQPTLDACNSGP